MKKKKRNRDDNIKTSLDRVADTKIQEIHNIMLIAHSIR